MNEKVKLGLKIFIILALIFLVSFISFVYLPLGIIIGLSLCSLSLFLVTGIKLLIELTKEINENNK